jgi:hypothetical protein
MVFLVFFVLTTVTMSAAWVWARGIARNRPHSTVDVVLRAIDDRILWTSVTAGVGLSVVWQFTYDTASWLTWSWWQIVVNAFTQAAPTSPPSAMTIAMAIAVAVLLMVVAMPLVVAGHEVGDVGGGLRMGTGLSTAR